MILNIHLPNTLITSAYGDESILWLQRLPFEPSKDEGIYARRYFFPLISDMPNYKTLPSAHRDNLPMAAIAAQQVLCLPFYPNLSNEHILEITNLIRQQKGAC